MLVVPERFVLDTFRDDVRPFVNGNRGVPFDGDELLDVLAEVVKGVSFAEDCVRSEGGWLADIGRAGEKLAPVRG